MNAEEVNEKLNYMPARLISGGQSLWRRHAGGHENPCKGVWQLAGSTVDYKHSPALIYITGYQGFYPVTHYMEIEDIDLPGKSWVLPQSSLQETQRRNKYVAAQRFDLSLC